MAGTRPAAAELKVLALVAAFNEEDIVGQVVADLVAQGVQVYFIDDGSTDSTVGRVEPWLDRGVIGIERRPPAATGSWAAILRRKEELAAQLDADWFLHHDADELRESPWDGVSLRDAIARVDRLGYNAIDFRVLDFWPTDESWRPGDDPRRTFTHFVPGHAYDELQIKAWKKTSAPVELVSSGGHQARFSGRRVFPLRFLLRHYAIRSSAHRQRKVFHERLPRLAAEARERGWHRQYLEAAESGAGIVRDPATLRRYDAEAVRLEICLHHRVVEELEHTLALARASGELDAPAARLAAAEARGDAEWERAENLGRELDIRNREAERLGRELDARNRETLRLAGELDARNRDVQRLGEELEAERARLAGVSQHLAAVLASRSWRWTAPLRALLRGRGAA